MTRVSGPRLRRVTVCLAVAAAATSCQGWRQVPKPAAGGSLEGNPDEVRVTRTMGCGPTPSPTCVERRGTITLFNPRIQGDSLIGYYDRGNLERVAIAVVDITNVESRKVDKVRTTGAILGGAVATAAILSALALIALLAALN